MTIGFMRAVDWYLGIPACWLLALVRAAVKPLRGRPAFPYRRIVVVKLLGSGSLVLAAPAIRALRDLHPSAKVTLVTFAENREVAGLLGLADEILTIRRSSAFAFILDAKLAVLKLLVLRRPDLAVDLEFFSKFSVILAALSGARVLAGFHLVLEPWRSALLDVKGYYNHYRHVREIFLSLSYLLKTGDPTYDRFEPFAAGYPLPALPPSPRALAAMRVRLRAAGAKGPVLLVNPNASADTAPHLKRWPVDRFAGLCEGLLAGRPRSVRVVLIGGPADEAYNASVVARVEPRLRGRVVNFAGRTRFTDLPALFRLGTVLVSVDSGPMHLAACTGIPIVGLFFAETPVLYAPLGARSESVAPVTYALPMFTVYTGKQPIATRNAPARRVGVPEVLAAVRRVLGRAPAGRP